LFAFLNSLTYLFTYLLFHLQRWFRRCCRPCCCCYYYYTASRKQWRHQTNTL